MSQSQKPSSSFDPDSFKATYPDYNGQLANIETLASKDADTVPIENVLEPEIADAFPHDLFTHQADALTELQHDRNVCVATSTSSGKTMVYALQIARNKLENPDSKALLLYPTKALSRDQEQALNDLYATIDAVDITVAVYDGDTPSDRRRRIREQADVIITNFSGINTYLADHRLWDKFYRNIELIAIDESHSYTGIHGMHVAWTIRRLRRVLHEYESNPQFVLTSATIGNPEQHSKRLTGVDVEVIDNDGSPRGRRDIVFWQPPIEYPGADDESQQIQQKPAGKEASEVVAHLAHADYQTLMFTRSRKQTELNAERARKAAADHPTYGDLDIESYNAGHGKKTRRSVENRLKSGDMDGVITTNALELGIDIGSVDATVVSGYPGTRQSFWQQIGRAGRGTSDALGVYVPQHDSIDQYIIDNPEYILSNDNIEDAVIDLENNFVFSRHVLVASNELPLTREDAEWFDAYRLEDAVKMWRNAGMMVGTLDGGAQYDGSPRPQRNISMYATSDEQFDVRCNMEDVDIEPIGKERAYRDYHEGAIVLNKGQQFEVVEFNEDTSHPHVKIEPVNVSYYTQALSETRVSDLSVETSRELTDHITLYRGTGTVNVTYTEYQKKNINSNKSEPFTRPIDLPPIEMQTQLLWLEFDDELIDDLKDGYTSPSQVAEGGLHALEHGIISMAPLELRMDKQDLGGLSQLHHPEMNDNATIFIYDGVNGGVGFSRSIYEHFDSILMKTRKSISECSCTGTDGCPACVMEDSCGNNNERLHTGASVKLIDYITGALTVP